MKVTEIITKAKKEVGTTEYPPNSNNIIYNTWYYGHAVNDNAVSGYSHPWCAVFISWLFDGTGLVKKTASCMEMGSYFKNNKKWFTSPKIGDIVFYKFGSNNRWTNHVGLVVALDGNAIVTIEGNTSEKGSQDNGGAVLLKRRKPNNVVGYGRPSYSDQEKIEYYPSYDGSAVAIDQIFRQVGVPDEYIGGWEKRKPIASANGITNYTGSGQQNTILCDLARRGQLKRI